MATLFHQGGPTMYWILMLVLPGLALVILHIVLHRGWTLWSSVGVMALVLAIALYGWMQGRSITNEAVSFARTAAEREEMRDQGYMEASRPLQLAGVVDVILGVGVVIGQIRRRKSRLF